MASSRVLAGRVLTRPESEGRQLAQKRVKGGERPFPCSLRARTPPRGRQQCTSAAPSSKRPHSHLLLLLSSCAAATPASAQSPHLGATNPRPQTPNLNTPALNPQPLESHQCLPFSTHQFLPNTSQNNPPLPTLGRNKGRPTTQTLLQHQTPSGTPGCAQWAAVDAVPNRSPNTHLGRRNGGRAGEQSPKPLRFFKKAPFKSLKLPREIYHTHRFARFCLSFGSLSKRNPRLPAGSPRRRGTANLPQERPSFPRSQEAAIVANDAAC